MGSDLSETPLKPGHLSTCERTLMNKNKMGNLDTKLILGLYSDHPVEHMVCSYSWTIWFSRKYKFFAQITHSITSQF